MKKLFLIAAIAASLGANAQAGFGIQAGGNLGNIQWEDTEGGTTTEVNTTSKFGFLIGVLADVPLSTSLSFRPELNFIQKGAKLDDTRTESGASIKTTGEVTLNFIELPLNLVYNASAGMGSFFIGAGPSIGFGISGKYDQTSTLTFPGFPTTTSSEKGDVKFDGKKAAEVPASDNDAHLKSLDFGVNALAGYKMANGVFLNVGYTLGLSNLDPNENSSFKTKGFTIKLGYMFGGGAAE